MSIISKIYINNQYKMQYKYSVVKYNAQQYIVSHWDLPWILLIQQILLIFLLRSGTE